ncbi:MAG: S-layer protein, partial [Planctomycetales bacterium]|nr:S-layer protein [Planctomycetales bacterium]
MHVAACLLLTVSLVGEPPSFSADVLPILTKAGCNTASCHGSAAGRGGLRLSLYGGDPAADYDALVRAHEGRRVNLARPGDSLLLAKPTGWLDHGGGVRLEDDGPHAQTLVQWIEAGAPRGESPQVVRLDVSPSQALVDRVPAELQFSVFAVLADGARRDVGRLAVYTPHDDSAVTVDAAGAARVLRRGSHHLVVRYLNQVVAATISVPLGDEPVYASAMPR